MSRKNGGEKYVKSFDGYTHLLTMLFAVIMRFDSLREIEAAMTAEVRKLRHIGIEKVPKRSTLSDANARRSEKFFEEVYRDLYEQNKGRLSSDSRRNGCEGWIKQLRIIDSTTVSLFSNAIFKGVGRHPKTGKKKGGIKVHSVIHANEGVPCDVQFTSAATNDSFMLAPSHYQHGEIVAMDRAYVDYAKFEDLTERNVVYVTKLKKNLVYETLSSTILVTPDGKAEMKVSTVRFRKGEVTHTARMIEYWTADGRHATLLTNNFDMQEWDIVEVYARRWQIELLFKQLKQNFPLKYFYGESVNAIESQIWVTLIANLLLTVARKRVRRRWAFSNLVTAVRQMLMYYVDIFAFLENPEQTWDRINAGRCNSPTGQLELPFS
jgi:hypothetical protein